MVPRQLASARLLKWKSAMEVIPRGLFWTVHEGGGGADCAEALSRTPPRPHLRCPRFFEGFPVVRARLASLTGWASISFDESDGLRSTGSNERSGMERHCSVSH